MARKWQDEDDDLEWVDELEAALILEATSPTEVLRLCKGKILPERLRPKVWQTCLSTEGKTSHVTLSEIFDLPEQTVLRGDCQKFVANLGNDDEDKLSVISDLETILTTYRKSSGDHYERNNGWLELMLPLLSLKRQQVETYSLFTTIRERYIPHGCTNKKGDVFHLFRLLLLYHEPELCSFLDTKRITPDLYCSSWFQTLFSANCNLKVVLAMWDLYFQQGDPYFLFFLALVMVVNAKDQILEMEKQSKEDVIEMLSTMPSALEVDDVPDFCSLAQYYALKTPSSFRVDLEDALFGIRNKSNSALSPINSPTGNRAVDGSGISQALCLPVSALELVENVSATATSLGLPADDGKTLDVVRFFLVDCRPVEQYNAGHLPTAFHLDCNLMLQEPAAFSTAVQGLLSAQRKAIAARSAAGGEHLCFLGSGRNEEDQYTHMVVASFLQKHTHYVSMLSAGYEAIHHYLSDNLSENLEHHNPQSCLVCISNTPASTPSSSNTLKSYPSTVDIFSKFSAAVSKIKAAEVKGKLLDYIVNPTSSANSRQTADRHVNPNDKLGRRYRNVSPVFSIDDEEPDPSNSSIEKKEESNQREIVHLSKWSAQHPVVASFYCQEIKVNRTQYDSMLMLTDSHLYLLRMVPGGVDSARVVAKRALESIVKITSRKKQPEIVTFKYGYHEEDEVTVTDMDRLYIPEGKEATLAVVNQVKILIKKAEGKSEEIEEAPVANSLHEKEHASKESSAPEESSVPEEGLALKEGSSPQREPEAASAADMPTS